MFSVTDCDVTEEDSFGERAGVIKAIGGLFAGETAVDKTVVMVQVFEHLDLFRVVLFGIKFWGSYVGEDHGAFSSVKDGAGVGNG